MDPQATPYDILDPTPPPLVVSQSWWILLLIVFVLAWTFIWFYRKQHRKRALLALHYSPLLQELHALLSAFQKDRRKESLHLFVKLVRRSPGISPEVEALLHQLEAVRFAPEISVESTQAMQEILSMLAHGESQPHIETSQREAGNG